VYNVYNNDHFKVLEFHKTYNMPAPLEVGFPAPERVQLRLDLIEEEYKELQDAVAAGDMVETADALGDLIYVVYGMAIELGIPLPDVVEEIHRSNMSKLGLDGHPIYRYDGKVLKGPHYTPPNISSVLGLTPNELSELRTAREG
jgi:predicted HAD superfamily Cof-like phosphohydrolase